jgi:transposase
MLDSFFVKTREKIEALMMCMALCLLVYNFAQYRVRKTLSESDETIPNQLGKPIKNPTIKWLFQCMEGIAIIKNDMMACITNLSNLNVRIIMNCQIKFRLLHTSRMRVGQLKSIIEKSNKPVVLSVVSLAPDERKEIISSWQLLLGLNNTS